MSKEITTEELKSKMLAAHEVAETAAYLYFCSCDIGPERTRAGQVYENIRTAVRVPL